MAAREASISNNTASASSEIATRVGENLAPFNPSMQPVVSTALELLQLKADDVLYELGCGDGRVMVREISNHFSDIHRLDSRLRQKFYGISKIMQVYWPV